MSRYGFDPEYEEFEGTASWAYRYNGVPERSLIQFRSLPGVKQEASTTKSIKATPYGRDDVDFAELAKEYPDFAAFYDEEMKSIDFKNPKAVIQLAKTILKHDFDINADFPEDRLCPPVPIRWNYIHWIQGLLDSTSGDFKDDHDTNREVVGLDVGTGASAIFPLLACASRPSWRMYATDIDEQSLKNARDNINLNSFSYHITTILTTNDANIIPLAKLGVDKLDVVIFNPPFYNNKADMDQGYENKERPAAAVMTGSNNELMAPGGDLGFVLRMLEESKVLKDKIQWYTVFVGKYSSVLSALEAIKKAGINNFAVTTLTPGNRTRRWGVAWSYGDLRPKNSLVRDEDMPHQLLPFATAWTLPVKKEYDWALGLDLCKTMEGTPFDYNASTETGIMLAPGNVWGRKARRKRKREEEARLAGDASRLKKRAKVGETGMAAKGSEQGEVGEAEEPEPTAPVALGIKIVNDGAGLEIQWLQGVDFSLYQSFCKWLLHELREEEESEIARQERRAEMGER